MKDKKKTDATIILATPENSEIVEDSPRLHHAANRFIPLDKDPVKEVNKEMCSAALEKNCTCQLEDTEGKDIQKLSATSSEVECSCRKSSTGQEISLNAGSSTPANDRAHGERESVF